ncbi:probable Acyl-CoA dehydrogenase [Janibacter sp. HTCC2649]|uniref:acyl-CoA dehydrogenase family protein n=1 Tax=Janibacter sp. HTCC2649 TaxID=313589 RepID=UPI0000670C34|nr:acyl-CoA dehydrogenase family protein [Janibacter sp. HTCC2649]EAQ00603.1 probable Acyl-CoA dehydrogenase [Janibacter sp. HTCC2649]
MATATPGEDFRMEVRDWLDTTPRPEGLHDYGPTPTPDDITAGRAWQGLLAEAGYACLHWPKNRGGREASVADQAAFAEECALAGVPRQFHLVGPDLAGPVLMAHGSAQQCDALLEPIRTGEHLWCQLFSEPGAGSDLASVRTRALASDSGWVVDGQKVWTSGAADAQYGLLLARTGGPGHAGLSAFVVPMDTDGITVRPLQQMNGESKFNEVFLDNVLLPHDSLIGAEGEGWAVATATLGRERLSLGSNAVGMLTALQEIVTAARARGRLDDHVRGEVVNAWLGVWLLRSTWERAIAEGTPPGGPAFSVLKLISTRTYQAIGDLGMEALGLDALTSETVEPLVDRMLVAHAQTILGGTTEIQRNILGERILGLPREPKP